MPKFADWVRVPVTKIEDLQDAVWGAGLEATQMSTDLLSGKLAFSKVGDVVCSSGLLNGQVALRGPLSEQLITIGVGLRMGAGTRHWFNETKSGAVGVFLGGDEHDAFYTSGSLYATVTLSLEHLEETAAEEELVLNRPILGGTGIHREPMAATDLRDLRQIFGRIHSGRLTAENWNLNVSDTLLRSLIRHVGRDPLNFNRRECNQAHSKIVRRVREYIFAHLTEPMSPDDLAKASFASRRTLFRAFAEIFDDTPQGYVRRLRLHRIRNDLAIEAERACTIALIANQWGFSELGRMSGRYRELFGESPSETLSAAASGRKSKTGDIRLALSA